MRTLLAEVASKHKVKANLGHDCLRPPLGPVNVRAMQQRLETEGLVVVLFASSCWEIQCNSSGCGSCFINGKGWWAVKADSGSLAEQL